MVLLWFVISVGVVIIIDNIRFGGVFDEDAALIGLWDAPMGDGMEVGAGKSLEILLDEHLGICTDRLEGNWLCVGCFVRNGEGDRRRVRYRFCGKGLPNQILVPFSDFPKGHAFLWLCPTSPRFITEFTPPQQQTLGGPEICWPLSESRCTQSGPCQHLGLRIGGEVCD